MRRRTFIRSMSAAVGGLAIAPSAKDFFNAPTHPAGLQLFTLFNFIDEDVKGNLQKVADIGYKEIESAFSKKGGFYGMSAKDFKSMVEGMGMKWVSHHVLGAPFKLPPGAKMPTGPDGKPITIPPMKTLRDNYQELIDAVAEVQLPYLVCANTPIGSLEELNASIKTLNTSSEAANKAGIMMAYHNHDAEFGTLDGEVIYDRLLNETNPAWLKMELDLAWVVKAGLDPVAVFEKNPGRFPLWHVKDLDKTTKSPAPVGTGVVDFQHIFDNAAIAGMEHYFVEHDMPADAFESIKKSIDYLENKLHV